MENETFVIAHRGNDSNTLLSTSPLSPRAAGLLKDPPAYYQLATSVPGIKHRLSGHSDSQGRELMNFPSQDAALT